MGAAVAPGAGWQISGEWAYDAELHTEVEVSFVPEGPDRTRVELEHRGLDAYGEQMDECARSFDSPGGWAGILERLRGGVSVAGRGGRSAPPGGRRRGSNSGPAASSAHISASTYRSPAPRTSF